MSLLYSSIEFVSLVWKFRFSKLKKKQNTNTSDRLSQSHLSDDTLIKDLKTKDRHKDN